MIQLSPKLTLICALPTSQTLSSSQTNTPSGSSSSNQDSDHRQCGLYHLSHGLKHLQLVQQLLYLLEVIAAVHVTNANILLELKFIAVRIYKDIMEDNIW